LNKLVGKIAAATTLADMQKVFNELTDESAADSPHGVQLLKDTA
jgi:hypothetical protein